MHLGDGAGNFSAPGLLFTTGGSDTGIASGDFNGDGKVDLAIGSQDASSVFVYFGNGDGTFTFASEFDTGAPTFGAKANSVAAIDVNGDGHLDLIASNGADNSVSVFLNNGTGAFGPPTLFSVGTFPGTVVGGDFNNDGKIDLAVSDGGGNTVTVLFGDGTGRFTLAGNFAVNGSPAAVAVADFNRDGNLDVATPNQTNGLASVLLGAGNGQLGSEIDLSGGGSNLRGIVDADLTANRHGGKRKSHGGNDCVPNETNHANGPPFRWFTCSVTRMFQSAGGRQLDAGDMVESCATSGESVTRG